MAEQATYTRNQPEQEGAKDSRAAREKYEREGPGAAISLIREEVNAAIGSNATREELTKYFESFKQGLGERNGQGSILPQLSIAFGLQHRDEVMSTSYARHGWPFSESVVDSKKVGDAITRYKDNPLYQELFRNFKTTSDSIRKGNGENINPLNYGQKLSFFDAVLPETQLRETAQTQKSVAGNRQQLGALLTHPELFKEIAGRDGIEGEITKQEATSFRDAWNSDAALRNRLSKGNKTVEREMDIALTALVNSWDKSNYNKNYDNTYGSVLNNHLNSNGIYGLTGIGWFDNDGTATEASLLRGMDYRTVKDAQAGLPLIKDDDHANGSSSTSGEKPIKEVTRLDNFDNTKLGHKQGPWHVANQMLQGQEDFFNGYGGIVKARADLTKALGTQDINGKPKVHNEREGSKQLNEDNFKNVIDRINELKNPRLRDWLLSRYPGAGARYERKADAPGNFDETMRTEARRDADQIARHMLRESTLETNQHARKILTEVLAAEMKRYADKEVPIINPLNAERVARTIEARNQELGKWFRNRYLK